MIGFIFILTLFVLGLVLLDSVANAKDIKENWPKHRCKITIMPFASLYGHDPQENFNFCMQSTLSQEAGPLFTPVFQIFGVLLSTISIIMNVMNSLRVSFATFMGGVNLMFQNFADRITQLTYRLRMSAAKTKSLMMRVYGTFFAIIYAGVSGMRAANNFGNTFLFRFLDTFCFDPTTPVDIVTKGIIPIRDVEIGDVFASTKSRVTARFTFLGDGQPMVKLGQTVVSTNHFLKHHGKWIRAEEHPDAIPQPVWAGGKEAPLICFNTSDHQIPIVNHIFCDYDETEKANEDTMKFIESRVNAGNTTSNPPTSYSNVLDPSIQIQLQGKGSKSLSKIQLGDQTETGKVIGIVDREIADIVTLPTGEKMGAGTLLWKDTHWTRAHSSSQAAQETVIYRNLFLTPSAILFTCKGTAVRDYMELHSQEAEQFYDTTLRST
jgi:hypothetical protein